jgi:dihydroorotase
MRIIFCILFLISTAMGARAQQYDLLVKNGRVIDPKNKIDAKMDVAIAEGKISKVAKDIPATQSKKVIDATGWW